MIPELRQAYQAEMDEAKQAAAEGDLGEAMSHLHNAHVLGQYHIGPHVLTHWWMLRIAARRKRLRDAAGQAVRIVLGAIGSALGRVPRGNTGGSDVSMFAPMPLDPHAQELVEKDRTAPR